VSVVALFFFKLIIFITPTWWSMFEVLTHADRPSTYQPGCYGRSGMKGHSLILPAPLIRCLRKSLVKAQNGGTLLWNLSTDYSSYLEHVINLSVS
jgi:hypothetical protein